VADSPLALGTEFPDPTREQWLELVDKVLAGAPFDRRLVTTTADGLRIEPLYVDGDGPGPDAAGAPGAAPFVRAGTAGGAVGDGWDVRQWHGGAELAAVNAAILADLARGATSIALGPVAVANLDDLDRLLDGVFVDLAPVALAWGSSYRLGAELLPALWARRGVPPSKAVGHLGVDPLGALAREGSLATSLADALADVGTIARHTSRAHPGGGVRAVAVDATVYADAGGSDAQELAFALATGVAYLRAMADAGLDVDAALSQLSFTFNATVDQFSTMAKLRAARRCWARVAEASGAAPDAPVSAMHIDAITARAMYSQRDPWVNVLRATLATFAAGVAGADSITVLPLGAAADVWDDIGRRLARNTPIVLQEESGLSRVIDPAGGSGYVESLTDALAQQAWARFQELEAGGGMAAALTSGQAAKLVSDTWTTRLKGLATRKDALTGVSEFPNLAETPRTGPSAVHAFPATKEVGPDATQVEALPLRRLAEPFERLRDAADAMAASSGARPRIFSANLGPVATHTARATFAKNLFEVAGIEVPPNAGFGTDDEAAAAFQASGTPLAVICSSDAVYAERAASCARALKAAGCQRLYLAGNPGDARAEYEAAGIDEFVFLGVDVLDVGERALRAAGADLS
jgi:methylmalonyl-CoA mutase